MKKLSLVLLLAASLPSIAEEIPGELLLSYFSGNCRSYGQWTQMALEDSKSLVRYLNALEKDPDCAGATAAISQLSNLSSQLTIMKKMDASKEAIANFNAEEQELLIQLTKTSNQGSIDSIQDSLRTIQVKRAVLLNGSRASEKLSGDDYANVLSQVAHSANSSFQQLTSSQRCLDKNPGILDSATKIMAGVGSAVTMVNPAMGIAITGGAVFTSVTMDGIKKTKNARAIRRITDNKTTFQAYKCALESMTERWCQMKDAESFLNFKASQTRNDFRDAGLAQAVSLNDKEIPAILDWLNKLRNGVSPQTTADSDRRNEVLTRELIVRSKEGFGLSKLDQSRETYNSYEDKPNDQWALLRALINDIAPQSTGGMNTTSVKDPMYDVLNSMYAPYFLLGYSEDSEVIRNKETGNIEFFGAWNKPATAVYKLEDVRARYEEWIRKASTLVNRELSKIQQPDALLTLTSANIESEPWMVTPLDSLKKIADFIERNPPQHPSRDFTKIYRDTLDKLRSIHDITTAAILTNEDGVVDLQPIEEIYELAQLKYGIVVMQARLEMIVKLSLLEYLKKSPEEDQILVAQLLASDRFYETISSMSGTTSFALLKEDLKYGQAYTAKNLSTFMELFGNNINRTLRNLYNQELNSTPTMAKINRDMRTGLCFVALGADNVNKFIETSLCKGLKIESPIPGGPQSPILDAAVFNRDTSERACVYREYIRQSDIYQKWKIKL